MIMERELAWKKYKNKQIKEMEALCKGYKEYLDKGKTERGKCKFITDGANRKHKAAYQGSGKTVSRYSSIKT